MPHDKSNQLTGELRRRGHAARFALPAAPLFAQLLLLALVCAPALAQQDGAKARATKLPAPDKIVNDYLKAVGGKKRVQSVRDATYEWGVEGEPDARARTFVKAPASVRTDATFEGGERNTAASARTAWTRTPDGALRTL